MKKPEFNDEFAKTKLRVHKTFGGKTVEILYGAKDGAGNPVQPKDGVNDGHGRWFGIEVNGEYTMFSWQHSAEEGGNVEYGTDHADHALEDMEAEILKKRELARQAEVLARGYEGNDIEEKMQEVQNEWNALTEWNTPVEEEYKERLQKAINEFRPRQESRQANLAQKEEIVAKAEALKDADNFRDARNAVRDLRNQLNAIGSAGEEADYKFKSTLNNIEHELREKQKEYNNHRDEIQAAAKDKKEELIKEAQHLTDTVKNFKETSDKMNNIFEEWKAAGHADRKTDDELWDRFNAVRNEFRKKKDAFYAERKQQWNTSIEAKKKLIEEAAEISAKKDYSKNATERMKQLDKEWRTIGFSGKDLNDKLWDEFNEAKEVFWDAKKSAALKRISAGLEAKELQLNDLKKKLEDAEYRIKIAPNPAMKNDAEIEHRNRLAEIDQLEAEIEADKKRLED